MPSKNFVRNRRIIIVLFCIGIAWLFYIFFHLHIEAFMNKNYLNRIVIIDGQKTRASARPDGDILTGSSSPAYAEFDVNDSLQNLYQKTSKNLTSQGYSTDGYADTSYSSPGYQRVAVKFIKGTKSIVLEYNFKEFITCDRLNYQQKPCAFDGYKDVSGTGLADRQVTKLKVFYDNN